MELLIVMKKTKGGRKIFVPRKGASEVGNGIKSEEEEAAQSSFGASSTDRGKERQLFA